MSQIDAQQPALVLPSRSQQLAALDLGSNSFHLLVAQENQGRIQVIDKHKEMVRLAAGLDADDRLSAEVTERALECLRRFAQRLSSLNPQHVRVVATNTLRKAQDARQFLSDAEQILGHRIEIISGREEARLIYLGVCHDLGSEDSRRLVVDIGGGSTEIILGRRLQPERLESLYMGCVSMSQRHFAKGKITKQAMNRATAEAMLELEGVAQKFVETGWESAIGASGTINAVSDVMRNVFNSESITRKNMGELRQRLLDAGHVDALDLPGLASERAAVFPGGVAILAGVFEALGIDAMTTAQSALREGVIYDLLGRQHEDDTRDRTVDNLMARFGVDPVQARQVRETAISLLSQVAMSWGLTSGHDKHLIAWAANLHELGMEISHASYHKHGAYLIANLDMPGFARPEQEQLALLVRTHRRRLPTDTFGSSGDYCLHLAVLLRISALLHRSRSHEPLPHIDATARPGELLLSLPKKWLKGHPLTALDLDKEATYLKALQVSLVVKTH